MFVCLFVCYVGRSRSFSIAISSVMIHTYTEVNGSCVHTLMVEHIPEGFTGKIDSAKINRGWQQHISVKMNAYFVSSAALVQEKCSLPEAVLSDAHRALAHLLLNISTMLGSKPAKLPKCYQTLRRPRSLPLIGLHMRSLSQGNIYVN